LPPTTRLLAAPVRVVTAVVVAVAFLAAACGESNPEVDAADARTIAALDVPSVPGQLHGLEVVREDVSATVEGAERPYFDAVVLYSLRDGDELQATLQVGRFAEGTPSSRGKFRNTLLTTIGGGAPKKLRMGTENVYLTSGDRQSIAIWFRGRHVFILSSREAYDFPRALLREALLVQP
jgi:hypothetical protein